jgi:hypothetical protein
VLVNPRWTDWPRLLETNAAGGALADRVPTARASAAGELGGERLQDAAREARRELIQAALDYTRSYRDTNLPENLGAPKWAVGGEGLPRVVAAGHQPELFHPGVWAKNFALSRFAAETGTVPINLVIDGDVLDQASIRVPTGSPADWNGPSVETVSFDAAAEPMPYEERPVLDDGLWRTFGRRAAELVRPLLGGLDGHPPLVERFWPGVVEAGCRTGRIGAAISQARHRLEGEWGAQTLELPQSLLCESRSFLRFAAYLVEEGPRFVEIHNRALAEYRLREGIRSANHPVPALSSTPDEVELPLWVWTADDPRRRHVFLRRNGGERELTDRHQVSIRLPSARDGEAGGGAASRIEAIVDRLSESGREGVRLRSRALVTTMFARLLLSDFFIHGIGGAKYDELTDTLIERFFGVRAPTFGVVTATRKLPIAGLSRAMPSSPSVVEHRLWEMTHHPERFLVARHDGGDGAATEMAVACELIEKKARLVATEPAAGRARDRCQAIRAINRDLQAWLADDRRRAEDELRKARQAEHVEGVVGSREYAFCLFPEKDLRDFLVEIPPTER